jgi:hypothetical protein
MSTVMSISLNTTHQIVAPVGPPIVSTPPRRRTYIIPTGNSSGQLHLVAVTTAWAVRAQVSTIYTRATMVTWPSALNMGHK